MTLVAASGRVWQRNFFVYRHLWHRSIAFGFLQPVLFLTAMGIGIGALLSAQDLSAFDGFDYLHWLAPGLLAAMAMNTATFESTFPIMRKIMWGRNYEAMLSTPLSTRSLVLGEMLWVAFRIGTLAAAFLVVVAFFGIVRSPTALLAIPVAMLIGMCFSTCLFAYTATQYNDVGFSAIFRFVINPLFLFSGTFFPLSRLPDAIEWIAWLTPLYHGVQLARGLVLDTLNLATAPLHLGYLLVMLAVGVYLADRLLRRRMAG